MRALILSAGLGERLRPLTLVRAKPAIEFLNMPMLAFPYYWLDTLGLTDIVFNTHHLPQTVRRAAMHVVNPETQMHFTFEDQILGSGGGIWNARFELQSTGDFAVANGDAVVTFDRADTLKRMLDFHRRENNLATILVCPLDGVGTRIPGVWMTDENRVVNFGKSPAREGLKCLHYASFMIFSDRVWRYLPAGSSNILYDVLMSALDQGESVQAFAENEMQWFETGNARDYLHATKTCLEALRSQSAGGKNLQGMLNRFQPEHGLYSDLAHLRLLAEPCAAELEGFAVIGLDAQAAGLKITDSVLLPGARPSTHVHESVQI